MNSRRAVLLLSIGLTMSVSAAAQAHQIWVEQNASGAKVYFGEFAENLHEVSPGFLDKFGQPTATLLSAKGEQPVGLTKTAGAFELARRARAHESIVVEDTNYPIIERPGGAKTDGAKTDGAKKVRKRWTPAARWVDDFSAPPPKLELDLLPTGKPGQVKVVFRGQPLPKAKVEVLAASGWGREIFSDEQGQVTFALPWKGAYLVAVHHEEAKPGKRTGPKGEEAYEAASFTTTLSFVTRTGLQPPPPPPPAAPNKQS